MLAVPAVGLLFTSFLLAMWPSLVPDKARPLTHRSYLIPNIALTCIFGNFLPPGTIRAVSVTGTILYFFFEIPKATTGKMSGDYMLPIQAVIFLIQWIDLSILHSPDDFSRIKDNGKAPMTFLGRLGWIFDLNATYRGIGWNWKVKNVPEVAPASASKWKFVRVELFKGILYYLQFDLTWNFVKYSRYCSATPPDLLTDTLPRQILFSWVPGLHSYYSLNMQYSIFSALTIALGLYTPHDWPPLMGRLRDVSTVREFWGKFWHQLLRRKLILPFNTLNRYARIPPGTLTSRYLQLYLAFITTALIHEVGALNVVQSDARSDWYQACFFLMQPLAITLEDFVVHLGRKADIKKSYRTKAIGAVWTFVWFSFSLRYCSAFMYSAGGFEKSPLPSIVETAQRLIQSFSR